MTMSGCYVDENLIWALQFEENFQSFKLILTEKISWRFIYFLVIARFLATACFLAISDGLLPNIKNYEIS